MMDALSNPESDQDMTQEEEDEAWRELDNIAYSIALTQLNGANEIKARQLASEALRKLNDQVNKGQLIFDYDVITKQFIVVARLGHEDSYKTSLKSYLVPIVKNILADEKKLNKTITSLEQILEQHTNGSNILKASNTSETLSTEEEILKKFETFQNRKLIDKVIKLINSWPDNQEGRIAKTFLTEVLTRMAESQKMSGINQTVATRLDLTPSNVSTALSRIRRKLSIAIDKEKTVMSKISDVPQRFSNENNTREDA